MGLNMLSLPSKRGFCGYCWHSGNRADLSSFPLKVSASAWLLSFVSTSWLVVSALGAASHKPAMVRPWCSTPHTAQDFVSHYTGEERASSLLSTLNSDKNNLFYSINYSKI